MRTKDSWWREGLALFPVVIGFAGWMFLLPSGALALSTLVRTAEDEFPSERAATLQAGARAVATSLGLIAVGSAARILARRAGRADERCVGSRAEVA